MKQKTSSASDDAACSVVEVRLNGKLYDLWLEGPEHAVKNALVDGSPYKEARVVKNPRGYNFDFLPELVFSQNVDVNASADENPKPTKSNE